MLPGWGVEDASEQASLGKRDAVLGADDEVIQDPNVDEAQGRLEALGNALIRLTRFGHP